MKESEKIALIKLIADPSQEVYSLIQDKILELGFPLLNLAHEFYADEKNPIIGTRLRDMNQKLVGEKLKTVFFDFKKSEQPNYREFLFSLSYIESSVLNAEKTELFFNQIQDQILESYNNTHTRLSKIKLLSFIIYHIADLKPITNNFKASHFYLNSLVETKSAISEVFGLLYIILGELMGIKLVPVYLPLAHILGVLNDSNTIEFYVNPGYQGAIVTEKEIENYLKRNHFKASERHASIVGHLEFIKKIMQMLELRYRQENDIQQADFILSISKWLH